MEPNGYNWKYPSLPWKTGIQLNIYSMSTEEEEKGQKKDSLQKQKQPPILWFSLDKVYTVWEDLQQLYYFFLHAGFWLSNLSLHSFTPIGLL